MAKRVVKKYLMDVVLIRLTLIFLMVLYHAFCPFTGAWEEPPAENFHAIEVYKWLGWSLHHFRLQTMVFISGLLFGYTLTIHPERLTFHNCVLMKAKRILLPGILFSILYYVMFSDFCEPWYSILYKLCSGCGHLWFLPMIFWCFVICYLIECQGSSFISPKVILAVGAVILFLPRIPVLALGLGSLPDYFFYFYFGFAIKRGYITFPIVKNWWCLLLLVVYIVVFICNEMIDNYWLRPIAIAEYYIRGFLLRLTHVLGICSMIVFLYSLANNPSIKHWLNQRSWLITLSGYCYGVYIYHQFILEYLYYKTPFTIYFSNEIFPWLGFLLALILSLGLCHLTLKTRWGRYMIG